MSPLSLQHEFNAVQGLHGQPGCLSLSVRGTSGVLSTCICGGRQKDKSVCVCISSIPFALAAAEQPCISPPRAQLRQKPHFEGHCALVGCGSLSLLSDSAPWGCYQAGFETMTCSVWDARNALELIFLHLLSPACKAGSAPPAAQTLFLSVPSQTEKSPGVELCPCCPAPSPTSPCWASLRASSPSWILSHQSLWWDCSRQP